MMKKIRLSLIRQILL